MSKVALEVTIWDERAVSENEAVVGLLGYWWVIPFMTR